MLMMISASAMDNKYPVIPGSICLLSVLILYKESRSNQKEKDTINHGIQEMGRKIE